MKPVVIIVKEKDGKLDITKEELDKIIESAYQNGYDDGLRETFKAYDKGYNDAKTEEEMKKIVPSQPYIPMKPQTPIDPTIPPYIITCDSADNIDILTNNANNATAKTEIIAKPNAKKKPVSKPKVENKKPYLDTGCSYLTGGI